jgi:type I protein arginine methyltransferase
MTCIKNLALSEPLVDIIERPLVMSNICPFFQVDLYTVKVEDLEFATQYSLKINRDDTIHALGGWFDVYFSKLNDPVQFSTSK